MHKYKVGSYIRLSRDESYSESDSIDNQIKLIDFYCKDNNLEVMDKYIDNGYSGTNFQRPEFKRLIEGIESRNIYTVVVKDLSRLGRNYILVGYYLEYYFPSKKIRFISINDDYDSLKNENIMDRLDIPLKNMLYDHMSYETSEKIKKSLRKEKENGKFIGSSVIYGYIKDPKDTHKLIIDKEAADVVKNIFDLYLQSNTKTEIANNLNEQEIMTPSAYKNAKGLGYTKVKFDSKWNYEMIDRILRDENYTGTLVQGRRRIENYKTHKEIKVQEQHWIKCENHHEPIIDKKYFSKTLEMLKIQRRTTNKNDVLSGYLKCADCNGTMILIKGKNKDYYYCRNNISKKICSKHRIEKNYIFDEIIKIMNLNGLIKENMDIDIIRKIIDIIYIYEDNKIKIFYKECNDIKNN